MFDSPQFCFLIDMNYYKNVKVILQEYTISVSTLK